eukprot:CAMPEP_0182947162 /NCGR_PEP_ID=MMETSP0105_2-20130417/58132_1 /TAXON_ID=81532 ORGANISM="Acanthoeca-like sp., Strain 10tr" /NCGR_SAMPLE_ID=MMETSP0105_2 /ASSEMBLY_ACC=CAM_ASM_000205 /LENGTH=221 /DNA_ID=CAMNT_0025087355 /DNA_START=17 /DNA_END=678 /DNA_ORIENTATION=+
MTAPTTAPTAPTTERPTATPTTAPSATPTVPTAQPTSAIRGGGGGGGGGGASLSIIIGVTVGALMVVGVACVVHRHWTARRRDRVPQQQQAYLKPRLTTGMINNPMYTAPASNTPRGAHSTATPSAAATAAVRLSDDKYVARPFSDDGHVYATPDQLGPSAAATDPGAAPSYTVFMSGGGAGARSRRAHAGDDTAGAYRLFQSTGQTSTAGVVVDSGDHTS